jgi:acetylornithine deacetylase/succinyl-diaminopimelate desuccinylase-like protein
VAYGLRGLVILELEVRSASQDLHSGQYGGVVHNPLTALVEMLAKMHNENGTVTIPGFYDDVLPLSEF